MSNYNWKTQSFLQRSTSKPLAAVIVTIFFGLIATVVFSCFYQIHRVVIVEGEVLSVLGEKEIIAPLEGKIINFKIEVGQKVSEGQILGQIQIADMDEKVFDKTLKKIYDLYTNFQSPGFDMSQVPDNFWDDLKTTNSTIMKHIVESETSWRKYQLALHEADNSFAKKLKILNSRKSKIKEKLDNLNSSKQIAYLRSLNDELTDQIQQLENEENTIKEEIHQKIQNQKNETLSSLKLSYLGLHNLYESTLIRAYSDGVIARKMIHNSQYIQRDQKLLTMMSDQALFQLQLSIPAADIGKVSVANQVKIAIESFPYQKFGHFQGEIESIDQTITVDKREAYLARSSLRLPSQIRTPNSEIKFLPGMKAKVYIQTRKLPLFQLVYEKIFTDDAH